MEPIGTRALSPRTWDDANTSERSATDGAYADLLYSPAYESSNRAVIDAVGAVASGHGVSRAQVALAWLRSQPVVVAPLVGANSIQQIDDAVASLDLVLTDEEVRALEAPYTPRYDFQGVSDERELDRDPRPDPGHGTVVLTDPLLDTRVPSCSCSPDPIRSGDEATRGRVNFWPRISSVIGVDLGDREEEGRDDRRIPQGP